MLYVQFSDARHAYSVELDDDRSIDYADDRHVIGIEFLNVSRGVSLRDVPHASLLAPLLAKYNIRELV